MTVVSSWGCLALEVERRLCRLITGHEGSSPRSVPDLAHRKGRSVVFLASRLRQARAGVTVRAMAQMKPANSRAIAVVATTFGLPAAIRCR